MTSAELTVKQITGESLTPKTIEEQKELINKATIRTTIINGRKVRIIPQGLTVTNKVFDN